MEKALRQDEITIAEYRRAKSNAEHLVKTALQEFAGVTGALIVGVNVHTQQDMLGNEIMTAIEIESRI